MAWGECNRTQRWGSQKSFERVGMALPDEPRGGLNAVSPWARSEASPTAAQGVGGATPSAGSHPPAETRKPRGGGTRSAAGGRTQARGSAQPDDSRRSSVKGANRGRGSAQPDDSRRSSVEGANPGRGNAQPYDRRRSSVGGANRRRGSAHAGRQPTLERRGGEPGAWQRAAGRHPTLERWGRREPARRLSRRNPSRQSMSRRNLSRRNMSRQNLSRRRRPRQCRSASSAQSRALDDAAVLGTGGDRARAGFSSGGARSDRFHAPRARDEPRARTPRAVLATRCCSRWAAATTARAGPRRCSLCSGVWRWQGIRPARPTAGMAHSLDRRSWSFRPHVVWTSTASSARRRGRR